MIISLSCPALPFRSGCGKSTLLGIVAGLYEPSAGHVMLKQTKKVEVDGKDLEDGEIREPTVADIPYCGRELLRSQVRLVRLTMIVIVIVLLLCYHVLLKVG